MLKRVVLSLMLMQSVGFSQDYSYLELMFPDKLDETPILFVNSTRYRSIFLENTYLWEKTPDDIRMRIWKFINKQKKKRGIQHLVVQKDEVDNYNVEDYRFQVIPILEKNMFSNQDQKFFRTFIIYDRLENREYLPYGELKTDHDNPERYNERVIYFGGVGEFFGDLERIVNSLEQKGAERTFKIKANRKNNWIMPAVLFIAVPAAIMTFVGLSS